MNISSAPCSGADSAGRNENSINAQIVLHLLAWGHLEGGRCCCGFHRHPLEEGSSPLDPEVLGRGTWTSSVWQGHVGFPGGVRRNLSSVSVKSQTCLFWAVGSWAAPAPALKGCEWWFQACIHLRCLGHSLSWGFQGTVQHFCVGWCPVQHHCASVLLLPWPGSSWKA